MKSKAIVVTQDALFFIYTSRILSLQYMMQLVISTELRIILKVTNLSRIIAIDLVKEKITVLEAAHMDRNHCYTFLKQAVIWEKQFCSHCHTGYQHISLSSKRLLVVNYFKRDILMLLKALYKTLCLILVAHQSDSQRLPTMIIYQTKGYCTSNIS